MEQNVKNIVKRTAFSEIAKHLDRPEISVIIGPRQVGKTTLLGQLKDYLIKNGCKDSRIFSFNLDIITELELFENQQKFISFLKERIGKENIFVFIDEAQKINNAGVFFKGIYDLGLPVKFILTGSSALEIRTKIHESLTGRKRLFQLYPFSFKEYLSAKESVLGNILNANENISSYSQARILENLQDFLKWGGYPKICLENNITEKEKELKEIFASYIEKDIVGFLRIKNRSNFTNLVILLAAQTGQLLNIASIAKTLQTSHRTIENYLDMLEKTFIIKRVQPFFKNYRKEVAKMPKIYFLDNGIRNFALRAFQDFETRQDKGAVLENFIFTEILKSTDEELHFWRTKEKAEVDFVLKAKNGEIIPMEIKASQLKVNEIPRGLKSFIEKYQTAKAFVVNFGFHGQTIWKKTVVNFIYPWEFKNDF